MVAESAIWSGGIGSPRWYWARGRAGLRLEVEPAALRDLLALDERMRRALQQRLFDLFELAVARPAAACSGPMHLWMSGRQVRYSLDVIEKLVVVGAVDRA